MQTEIIVGLVGAFTTIVSGWTSYFFTRRKYDAQVNGVNLDNMQKSLKFYQDLCDANSKNLDMLTKQNNALTRQVVSLQNQVLSLQRQVAELAINICTDTGCFKRLKPEKPITGIIDIDSLQEEDMNDIHNQ